MSRWIFTAPYSRWVWVGGLLLFGRAMPCQARSLIDRATPSHAQPTLIVPTGDVWALDFSDEFHSFDRTKWVKTRSEKGRAGRPLQGIADWWWRPDHVSVCDGKLALKISKLDRDTMGCGSIETRGLYETVYGFMEARIQCAPIAKAAHTAFWMQGANQGRVDGSGADGCEVDIFESPYATGKECQTVLHWDGYSRGKQSATRHWDADDVYAGYHTFAVHWAPDCMDFYYDGRLTWHYDNAMAPIPGGVPKVAEWLWLSVGASFGDGDFSNETYPAYSYVDYVRVWKRSD